MKLYHNITVYNSHAFQHEFSDVYQTASQISQTVGKKVGYNEIISSINQSAETVTIKANRISLEGLVTANDYFKIKMDGSIEARNATLFGNITSVGTDDDNANVKTVIKNGEINFFTDNGSGGYTLSSTLRPYKENSKSGVQMVAIGSMLALSYDLVNPITGKLEWVTPLYINKDMNPTVNGKTYKQHVLMMDHSRVCNSHLIVDKDLVLFDSSSKAWAIRVSTAGALTVTAANPSDYGGL